MVGVQSGAQVRKGERLPKLGLGPRFLGAGIIFQLSVIVKIKHLIILAPELSELRQKYCYPSRGWW